MENEANRTKDEQLEKIKTAYRNGEFDYCDHVCSGDCRRDGCDEHGCTCGGEFHDDDHAQEVNQLLQYAIKNGFISEDVDNWTDEQKEAYYNKCLAYEIPND